MWEAIVVIVVVGVFARLIHARIHADARAGALDGPAAPPALPNREAAELQRELAKLRARVEVLERIATDGRHRDELAAEIEALRER